MRAALSVAMRALALQLTKAVNHGHITVDQAVAELEATGKDIAAALQAVN